VDRIVVGGDLVPGPLPVETLARLRALGERAVFVRGNGDRWVVEAFDALTPERRWRPALEGVGETVVVCSSSTAGASV
jgi:hypothetical protein